MEPKTAAELRSDVEGEAKNVLGMSALPVVCEHILRTVEELEYQGMEEDAYTVSMEQYIEVARDLCYSALLLQQGGKVNGDLYLQVVKLPVMIRVQATQYGGAAHGNVELWSFMIEMDGRVLDYLGWVKQNGSYKTELAAIRAAKKVVREWASGEVKNKTARSVEGRMIR